MTQATQDRAATAEQVLPDALLDALVQSSYAVVDAVTTVANHHELSLTLLRVIAILRDRTPTMSELATHLGLDRSSITGLIDRAVARDLIRKTGHEHDRRSTRVALTDTGRELAQTCLQAITFELQPMTTRLTATQRSHLTRLLQAMGVVD